MIPFNCKITNFPYAYNYHKHAAQYSLFICILKLFWPVDARTQNKKKNKKEDGEMGLF